MAIGTRLWCQISDSSIVTIGMPTQLLSTATVWPLLVISALTSHTSEELNRMFTMSDVTMEEQNSLPLAYLGWRKIWYFTANSSSVPALTCYLVSLEYFLIFSSLKGTM